MANTDSSAAEDGSVERDMRESYRGVINVEDPNSIPVVDLPLPRAPIVVEAIDRLKAENLNLKLINASNRETILQQQSTELQRQLLGLQRERQELVLQLTEMRQELEAKYGINLNTHQILPETGEIVPRATNLNAGKQNG